MIYFDNAATTFPKPPGVAQAIERAVTVYGGNPGRGGHKFSLQAAQAVYRTRELAGELFGLKDCEKIIFTQNCTHALNILIHGLLKQGDHVVISDLEHNSVLRPIHYLAQQRIISYSIAAVYPGDAEATVKSFAECMDSNTRLILCTHASNVFGTVLPIRRLAALAHSKGALFGLDAAQSAGVLEIDMAGMGIDFVCTAGHKGLYGPSGTGMLLIGGDTLLEPLTQGGTGSQSQEYDQPAFYPDRLESGTINTAGIIALGSGLEYVLKRTPKTIYRYEMGLIQQVDWALRRCERVQLYNRPPKPGEMVPVLSFNIVQQSGEETAAQLDRLGFALRGGLHCAPLAHRKYGTLQRGTARVSVGSFNTYHETLLFANAVKKL